MYTVSVITTHQTVIVQTFPHKINYFFNYNGVITFKFITHCAINRLMGIIDVSLFRSKDMNIVL